MHLAAIVGDPACARDPELSNDVNVEGSRALVKDARELGVERLIFASTCSNYGRMADPTVPIDESGELRPVSLYAEQKVGIEQALLGSDERQRPRPAPDLPPVRDRLRRRQPHALRPHRQRVHARPLGRQAARGVRRALLAALHPRSRRGPGGAHRAGRPGGRRGRQGVQRRPLRRELPQARPRGDHHREARQGRRGVRLPRRGPARLQGLVREDPRRARLRAREPRARRHRGDRGGARASSASAIPTTAATGTSRGGRPADPALRREAGRPRDRGRGGHAALRLAHHGPAHPGLRGGVRRAPRRAPRRSRSPAAPPLSISPTWRPEWARATR